MAAPLIKRHQDQQGKDKPSRGPFITGKVTPTGSSGEHLSAPRGHDGGVSGQTEFPNGMSRPSGEFGEQGCIYISGERSTEGMFHRNLVCFKTGALRFFAGVFLSGFYYEATDFAVSQKTS